ncbi:cellulose biosynthesis protein BcsQ [Pseudoalteromonas sp. SSMSWG5]|jgi:cellulose synthase operon protein YhjQ|uniref:cellulose biosynthesis protein BcsQ n=1 Tax=unclassified Pseudoalteromonas TaxID=194690 RepID=UPI000C55AD42|nr:MULTISPECIES: cellulose biosynthesis protein BcsQ [unclassified Pseudoalteromonas]MBD58271.1 cellulose synthase operon protein YhjQ [Pseudoalteromonas sp.]MBU77186.1 cellulose synthase operon protein YhjQ [Pseudoalteromonadaceae bacterium]MCF2899850.1 cellulose synthase operon protein YhjQ [Pseudoalteromonas sp. OFAV1]MCO7249862.1 cellulose biosynthesis protein BcsQ [Pseudoalteromonas sp. Ps84H-4]TGV21067.1 cellulose synthase operon protein YhjQ [Pseudoalteromonas sp. MEBiC 03607]|tara:strand:- start:4150 stop:4869 length:720 start_codon:yes stop_codon:yes gene_type:complete
MKRVFLKGIKGGTGTTSVVANLACALRKSNESVFVIDLDQKGDLGLHFGLAWEHRLGWTDYADFASACEQFHQDNDGVIFLPYGNQTNMGLDFSSIIKHSLQLDCDENTWMLFDCPAHIDVLRYPLNSNDIVLEIVNCDAICHSLAYKRLQSLKTATSTWQHYFLINKYHSASEIESDLLQLWQSELPLLAPLFINKDEVIKEATAFRNVAINCAPYSVANDDFETLAGWLVSRASYDK